MAVTPKSVYQSLINAGATKIQAIGIMANALNESGFNPEAVGDNGTSFGIVQQHGTQYAGLVTGNPSGDLTNQVKVIAQNGGFRAASGDTAGQAAGNFAAKYERCVGCQPGGAQYNQRVANAAVVAGWVTSGKWPATAGAASSQAAQTVSSSSSASSGTGNDCAFGPKLPVVGQVCLVKRATIRHMVGGGLMVAGFFVVLPGVVIILAYGFRASGAAAAVQAVPGYGRVAAIPQARRAASQARTRQAATEQRQAATRQRQQIRQENTEARRAAGGPAQQRRAVAGQAPRRRAVAAPAQQRAPRAEHHE